MQTTDNRPSVGAELCKALGLERVISLSIECHVEDVATVRVVQYLTRDQSSAVAKVLNEYRLEPLHSCPDTTAAGPCEAACARLENLILPE